MKTKKKAYVEVCTDSEVHINEHMDSPVLPTVAPFEYHFIEQHNESLTPKYVKGE